jgi:Protein of unknwon function (DUF3310).
MARLTQQELEKEVERFKKYLITPILDGIEDYKKNEFVQTILKQNVDFISSALIAYLARAELDGDRVMSDNVKNPKHYQIIKGIESIDIIARSMTVEQFQGFCLGNILKYRIRAGKKDALEQDIAKANEYEKIFENKKRLCVDAVNS